MKKVSELAKITGISRRAIRYYDEIGLLKPTTISESGYRLYDDNALEILQQILLFKELNVPLKDIKMVLGNPNIDKIDLLKDHKKILSLKRDHLTNLISLIDKIIKEPKLMIFNEFNLQKIEQTLESNLNILKNTNPGAYERYLKEYGGDPQKLISERMDYVRENPETIKILHGNLDNYNNALKKSEKDFSSALAKNDKMKENMTNFFEKLSKLKHKDPSDPEVQKLVSEFRKYSKTVYSKKDTEVMLQRAKLIQGNLESNPALKKELEKISEKHRKYYDDIYGQGFFDFWDKSIEYSKKVNK